MKKIILSIFLLFTVLTAFPEKIDSSLFEKGVTYYVKKEYEKALEIFLKMQQNGFDNFELNYNIGSCYFKMEKQGKARFHFERALIFRPFDRNLANNLKLVYSRVLDDPLMGEQEIMNKRMIFFIPLGLLLSIIILCLLALTAFIYMFINRINLRRLFLILGIVTASFLILFTVLFMIQYAEFKKKIYVVTSSASNIYLLPDEKETVLNTVTEGEKGDVIVINNDYVKIKLPDGSDGWIKKSDIIMN
jgi:tetratricopeptide (TPR) repeat protein